MLTGRGRHLREGGKRRVSRSQHAFIIFEYADSNRRFAVRLPGSSGAMPSIFQSPNVSTSWVFVFELLRCRGTLGGRLIVLADSTRREGRENEWLVLLKY